MSVFPHGEFAPAPNRPGVGARVLAGPEMAVTSFFLVEDEMAPGASIPLHWHPVEEVLAVTAGELTVTLGAETHVVSAGNTVVVSPRTPHRLENRGTVPLRFLAAAPWDRTTFYRDASTYLEGVSREPQATARG